MPYSTASSQVASKITECYRRVTAIAPANATAIGPFMGFIVGVAGTVALVPIGAVTPVSIAAVAGTLYPIAFQGVDATGTTATGIVGLG